MKKTLLIAVLAFFGISQSQAQVTFKPGIRAGANFSHFTKGDVFNDGYYFEGNYYNEETQRAEFKSKTDFYIGVYGALRLTRYYTLQPEINYSRQGSRYKYYDVNHTGAIYGYAIGESRDRSGQTDVSYLSIAMMNKFTFGEKFNVHIGPTLDFVVDKNDNFGNDYSSYRDIDSEVDLAFVAGIGFNFTKNIGIEARVKKGIIPVLDFSDSSHTNVVFSVGANYTFDIK